MTDRGAFDFIQDDPSVSSDCVRSTSGACGGEPFFREHEGKRYCVLHFPGAEKKEVFDVALKKKRESHDFNYLEVWFPDWFVLGKVEVDKRADFNHAVFNGRASFSGTTFKSEAYFEGATFNEDAHFSGVIFKAKVDFKSATFHKVADFSESKFEDYADFWHCTFMGNAEFRNTVFLQTASFWPATFNGKASFYSASFARANFRVSEFKNTVVFNFCAFGFAEFIDTSFRDEADFRFSRFLGMANFVRATFDSTIRFEMATFDDEARFTFATFNGTTDFSYSVFKDIVSFSSESGVGGFGENATVDVRHARFESPRRVSFYGLELRPHWFVNVNPGEFEFIDVKWVGQVSRDFIDVEIGELRRRAELERKDAAARRANRLKDLKLFGDQEAIEELKEKEAEAARIEAIELDKKNTRLYRLLSLTCRQLAVNAEENHRYDQASDFRFWSMELQRKEGWRARGPIIGVLHALYRSLSGYGERIGLALVWLFGFWLLFSILYTQVGFATHPSSSATEVAYSSSKVGTPLRLSKALAYSLATLTLQRPDPRPFSTTAWFLVLAETIVGPIQAALLILAVRRRFMR